MSSFGKLWGLSQRIGFAPTVLCAIAWLVCGTIGVQGVVEALWPYPKMATFLVIVIATITGIGGLVSFWLIADQVEFWWLGYRVRWVAGNKWVYEERTATGALRCLPCERVILGERYPAPCAVRIPSEVSWAAKAPSWAKDRRTEITQRIAYCFGADIGGQVHFVDS
jgi:hypothetical protein